MQHRWYENSESERLQGGDSGKDLESWSIQICLKLKILKATKVVKL